jgi:hypothetical protein
MATDSEEMGNGIDAVKMTRRIRDKRHERVKDMTREERLAYYQEHGAAAHERFMERIREEDR